MMRRSVSMFMASMLLLSVPASGYAEDLGKRLINMPSATKSWGNGISARKDKGVQGGVALRVTTTGAEPNIWDVGVYSPVDKPVKAGDRLVLAFWARVEKGPGGANHATLGANAIQLAAPPNLSIIKGAVTITPEWKLYQIAGRADYDYAPGTLNAALQLAAGEQTVDIGPIFVFNMGQ